ncbi:insecticidal delta-endotoxin Cry8Ea1 family protein [Bacillus cereus]|uniref:insecticidal delta-endotoxin Cry8Ea1 family protein n=1 Tax=Bacillus cereus TaxID=1396 RepID=UPI000DC0CA74
MDGNYQSQCGPYNCFSNSEAIILDEERLEVGNTVADFSLGLINFLYSNFAPGGGFVVGLLELIWGILGPSQWGIFLNQIEQMINQRIEEFARNQAISRMEGLGNLYNVYTEAFKAWEADPDNPALKEEMRIQFNDMNSALITAIPLLRVQNYEVALLSVYTQAANLHLSVLRDVSVFGQNWGFDMATINSRYSELTRLIHVYTDHCVDTYNEGLKNLEGPRLGSWVVYNRFRRRLTISVLDIIAFFPNYDIKAYPIQTTTQLTREIYLDLPFVNENVSDSRYFPSFSTVENAIIRRPHLVDFLGRLTVFTDRWSARLFWGGHRVRFSRTGTTAFIDSPIYGVEASVERPIIFSPSKDVPKIRTLSYSSQLEDRVPDVVVEGVEFQDTQQISEIYRKSGPIDSLSELPPENTSVPLALGYSHRLCHANFLRQDGAPRIGGLVFSWTHRSASPTNEISSSRITQIPLVKAHTLGVNASVLKGPGFTGGDILYQNRLGSLGTIRMNFTGRFPQIYYIRIRYASPRNTSGFIVNSEMPYDSYPISFLKTMEIDRPLTSRSFALASIDIPITIRRYQVDFELTLQSGVYIDRIEFVPADATFEAEYDLERVQKAVNALFTSTNQKGLQTDVTDYHIDQVSNLVDCLFDEFCLDEKRELSEKVKQAKRLSDERNLLQDSNFRGINREQDRGWRGSTDITIQGGNDVFKENYVTLPGAFDECYPTYLYQKIDESKLKAYTRYQLRGYLEDSQDLEIYLIRYNAKHETLNVPGTGSLWPLAVENPIGRCGEPNRCAPHIEWNPDLDCSCGDGEKCAHHSHQFSLDIDVGCTDLNEDLGVWVIFKIKTQDGYARLGNLEFLEEKPLVGEALSRVKRAEKKWRDKREKLQLETNIVYKEAKESVDALFVNSRYDRLQADTNIAMIHAADKRVHRIRGAYLPELSVIPVVNAGIFEELEGLIFNAFSLYDARNVIKNGDFNNGLSYWNVKGHVDVQQNNHRSVLVLPEWKAEVSQEVRVCPGRGYILRVTAYKEGYGEGCITIHEIENHTDKLKFRNCEEEEIYPTNTVTCHDYTVSQGAEGCADTCNSRHRGYDEANGNNPSVSANYTPVFEEEVYTDGRRDNPCEMERGYTPLPVGYVTKELEYFPETDTVWIEIGETEGTFIVDSVELLLMEE